MAASIGVRTALMRSLRRMTSTSTSAAPSTATPAFPSRASSSTPSIRSGFALRHPPASTSSRRFMRRELSSLLPLHSAVASARLISKLPDDAISFEDSSTISAPSDRRQPGLCAPSVSCGTGLLKDKTPFGYKL